MLESETCKLSPAYVFAGPELIIGRDTTAIICVPEQAVSRQHARIFTQPDASGTEQWFLQDLGSRNGTIVDGVHVTEVTPLEPNDDFGQANTLVNHVMDDAARERLVGNVAGHAGDVKSAEILERVFEYWKNIDADIGKRIEEAVKAEKNGG